MKKKTLINFIASFLYQISALMVGLVLPKYYTEIFGSVYNGLNQSIAQVMGLLAILQYGIAASSIQAMFKPIAEGDERNIAAIYRKTELQYRKMGYIFLLAILPIIILYPFAIKDDITYWIVSIFVVLRGISSAMEYFFQAKYNVILVANNRSYAIYFINTGLQFISVTLHLTVLFTLKNIIIYQSVAVIVTIIRLFVVSNYIKNKFPYLIHFSHEELTETKVDIKQRSDVMVSEIAGLVISSTPLIVLSTLSSLVYSSIYAVYNFVIAGMQGFLGSARESVIASMGKIYYSDKKNFNVNMDIFESIYFSIMLILYSTAILVFTPFISVYTRKMDAEYDLPYLPVLFVLSALIVGLRIPSIVAINIAGHFKQVKKYAIIEAAINITLSIVLTVRFNIYGVLISTIVAGLYRTPVLIYYTYKNIYQRSLMSVIRKILVGSLIFIFTYLISRMIDYTPTSLLNWLILAGIAFLIMTFVVITMLLLLNRTLLKYLLNLLKR